MCPNLELDLDARAQRVRNSWGVRHELIARFAFPFDKLQNNLVGGEIQLAQGPVQLSFTFACYGWDLEEFANHLAALHQSLDGEAVFLSQDGSTEIALQIVERSGGLIAIQIRLEQHLVSAITEESATRLLEFDGFAIDQSYLPEMASQIRRFLGDNGISTRHPVIDA